MIHFSFLEPRVFLIALGVAAILYVGLCIAEKLESQQ